MRHPTTPTRTTRPRCPSSQSPNRSKQCTPRQHRSCKRNRAIVITRGTIVTIMVGLIAYSSITNVYRLGGGGMDTNEGAAGAAAWDPMPPHGGVEKTHVFSHRKRATRNKTTNRGVVSIDGPLLAHDDDSPRRFSFRPHPAVGARQSIPSSSLPLPKPKTSIRINRSVCLDGIEHLMMGQNNADANLDNSLDEGLADGIFLGISSNDALAYRTQTVVWDHDGECVPMSAWQLDIHPTCNSLHEVDISQLLNVGAFSLVSSKGFWRNAWKLDVAKGAEDMESNSSPDPPKPPPRILVRPEDDDESANMHVVLKSIKYIHEPNKEVFELSRVDAISLDVLTKSRFTINIYGYCGTSSLQEFAGGDLKGLLPVLDPIEKLRMATWIANGVADIHAVDSWNSSGYDFDDEGSLTVDSLMGSADSDNANAEAASRVDVGSNTSATPVSLIHNDINMDNILLGYRNGIETPLINDFNIAVFRKRNTRTGLPCLFHGRFANPQWMSPEQQERKEDELSTGKLDEKIDIYALGNILYKIAVGSSPWKYDYNVNKITVKEKKRITRAKLKGRKPKVPPEVGNSTSPIKTILNAMKKCYRNDAKLRPTARELAMYLQSELDAIELPLKVMNRFEFDE